jgi:hypothetical protein
MRNGCLLNGMQQIKISEYWAYIFTITSQKIKLEAVWDHLTQKYPISSNKALRTGIHIEE